MIFERVLVTGGAGFIGSRVVRRLAGQGIAIAVVDNLYSGTRMPDAQPDLQVHRTDIRDRDGLCRIFRDFRPNAVVHLAAVHHIPTCESQPHLAMDVNVMGTQAVLDAAEKNRVGHFVLASSGAVYDWSSAPLTEDETPLRATDVYSTGKLANESQVAIWSRRCGAAVATARIFNVIGHDDPNGHLIPDILAQIDFRNANTGRTAVGLGNVSSMRDYTHVEDTADGLLAMLEWVGSASSVQAFNISSGEEHSVADIVRLVARQLNRDIEIVPDASRLRPVDRPSLCGDRTKSNALLHWSPRIPFEDAIADIVHEQVNLNEKLKSQREVKK